MTTKDLASQSHDLTEALQCHAVPNRLLTDTEEEPTFYFPETSSTDGLGDMGRLNSATSC